MHLFCLERQMHLPGTAEFAEALEDPTGDLLDAAIRIEAETNLPMPDKASRHGNPEFTPAGLGPCGVQHAGAQDAKLEFADAALHAQKQAIVGPAWIVDAIEIDDAGVDKTTQLKQIASPGRCGRGGRRRSKARRRPRRRKARRRASRSPGAPRCRWRSGRDRRR